MSITPAAKHVVIFGSTPTEKQALLYSKYPEFRGFSDQSLDTEVFDAAMLLTIISGSPHDRVLLFAPSRHESWVLDRFNTLIALVFENCRKHPKRLEHSRFYTQLFQKIGIMGRLLQLHTEPEHWISFGFSVDERLPEWMPKRLL